jgi:hypothetical protein
MTTNQPIRPPETFTCSPQWSGRCADRAVGEASQLSTLEFEATENSRGRDVQDKVLGLTRVWLFSAWSGAPRVRGLLGGDDRGHVVTKGRAR